MQNNQNGKISLAVNKLDKINQSESELVHMNAKLRKNLALNSVGSIILIDSD